MTAAPLVVLYDEDCRWCRWSIAQVLRADRRRALRPLPIQSPEGRRLLAPVPDELRLLSAHAVTPDGTVHSAGDASAPVAAVLPGGAALGPLARGLAPLLRAGYRVVAANRSRLGRRLSPATIARADALIAARRRSRAVQ